jgi:hypothetical protein
MEQRRIMSENRDNATATDDDAAFVFVEYDRRAKAMDTAGLLELYTDDATLETPLMPRLSNEPGRAFRGRTELDHFFEEGGRRRRNDRVRWYRNCHYLFDGHTLMWEYLRATPEGDQVDIAEVMELDGRRVAAHRIYWGWYGTEMLIANALAKEAPRAS